MADNKMVRLQESTWDRLTRLRGLVMAEGETWTYDRLINALIDATELSGPLSDDGETLLGAI